MPTGITIFPPSIYRTPPQAGTTTIGTTETTHTTTLGTAVGAKAYVIWNNAIFDGTPTTNDFAYADVVLASTTTVTCTRDTHSGDASSVTVAWTVLDPY